MCCAVVNVLTATLRLQKLFLVCRSVSIRRGTMYIPFDPFGMQRFHAAKQGIYGLVREEIARHRATFQPQEENLRDYFDAFLLEEQRNAGNPTTSFKGSLNLLRPIQYNLFICAPVFSILHTALLAKCITALFVPQLCTPHISLLSTVLHTSVLCTLLHTSTSHTFCTLLFSAQFCTLLLRTLLRTS